MVQVKRLRSEGVLVPGFSPLFAKIMCESLRALMKHTHAVLGYTQSDEIIVFIPPTTVVRGDRMPHHRRGRIAKLGTLAAGLVSSVFASRLAVAVAKAATAAGGVEDGESGGGSAAAVARRLEGLADAVVPHFDCRLAHFASWGEARALLLWRAHDCAVNGVSDAVHHAPGSSRAARAGNTREKVAWLAAAGALPLPPHQAYGTLLVKARRPAAGFDPIRGVEVQAERAVVRPMAGPVLELFRTGGLRDPAPAARR